MSRDEGRAMTDRDLILQRLHNQQILHPVLRRPGEVVARLGAVQAQDYGGALWSIGLRMPEGTQGDIRQALTRREITRIWLLRGTLHVVAPGDVRWILSLVAPRIIARSAGRHRQLGLGEGDFTRSRELLVGELEGGGRLTRDELYGVFDKGGISPKGQRGYHLLWRAGLEGLICFGPHEGNLATFVLLDEWVPHDGPSLRREDALALLAERYCTGHGPATLQDFTWWSGLTVSEAKAGMTAAQSRLLHMVVGGKEYFTAPNPGPEPGEPVAYLLPGFDEYILGYRDRSAMLDPAVAAKTVIGSNGMMLPTVVIDGVVAGTWKRTAGKGKLALRLHPFSPPGAVQKRLVTEAAERYGVFMGMPVSLEW